MAADLKKYEGILQKLSTEEKILKQRRRIGVFKGTDAVALLTAQGLDAVQIRSILQEMLDESVIFKVAANKKNAQDCDIVPDQRFAEDHLYVLSNEKTSHLTLILSGAFVLVTFCIVLFQMWPRNVQRVFSYLTYPLGGFIAFIGVLAVVRLMLFGATYFMCRRAIWLFPNLFEDVGFFESFVPLWEYHGEKKKKE